MAQRTSIGLLNVPRALIALLASTWKKQGNLTAQSVQQVGSETEMALIRLARSKLAHCALPGSFNDMQEWIIATTVRQAIRKLT